MRRLHLLALACLAAGACGDGSPAAPTAAPTARLRLEYVTPVPPDPLPIDAGMCMHHSAPAGLVVAHPSWSGQVRLQPDESAPRIWRGTLTAPAGRELKLALRDIHRCYFQPSDDGLFVRTGLTINGAAVSRIEPLSAAEPTVPAFVFSVGTDGAVR